MKKIIFLSLSIICFNIIFLTDINAQNKIPTISQAEIDAFNNFTKDLIKRGAPNEVAKCMSEIMENELSPDMKIQFMIQMNLNFYNKSFFIKWFLDEMSNKYGSQEIFVKKFMDEEVRVMEAAQTYCRKKYGYN